MNETIVYVLTNSTAQQASEVTNYITPLLSFLSPFLFIIFLIAMQRYSISGLFVYPMMRRLRKKTGMGVILLSGDISLNSMHRLDTLLEKAQKKGIKEIILILHTFGGYEFAMTRIVNSIRNFNGHVHAYIPKYSMSAGTMIALSCDTIHMSNKSALGAVDVQMGVLFWVYSSKQWQTVVNKKGGKADDQSIMMAMMAKQYNKLMRQRLDELPMLDGKDKFKRFISDGNIPHAQQLDKVMLQKFGLKVMPIEHTEIFEIVKNNPKRILMAI